MNELQVELGNTSVEEKQNFTVGDFVLLSTNTVDITRGVQTSGTDERKVKYVGPFKLVEERISNNKRYYRVDAPNCLGFSECFFDDSKVVMFQRREVYPGVGERQQLDRAAEVQREELGEGAFICKRHKGDTNTEQECMERKDGDGGLRERDGKEDTCKAGKVERQGEGMDMGVNSLEAKKTSEPSVNVKLETPECAGPSGTPPRRTSRRRESKLTEEVEEVRDKQGDTAGDGRKSTVLATPKVTCGDTSSKAINSILKTSQPDVLKPDEECPSGEGTPTTPAPEDPEVHIIDGEVEYEVEKILADRRAEYNNGYQRVEYLVKWKGYPESEATWEPRSNLTHVHRLLREYTRSKRKNGRR